jgi:hypothetical protein
MKMRIVFWWPDDSIDFDYDDIVALIRAPMCIADENDPEQEAYLRKYGRSFVRTFVARLREAMKIAEREGEEALNGYELRIWIHSGFDDDYCISFEPNASFWGAKNLSIARLRDLLKTARPGQKGAKEEKNEQAT